MALPDGWIEKPLNDTQESIDTFNGTIEAKRVFYGPWVDRFLFLASYFPTIAASGSSANRVYYPDIPHLLAYKTDIVGKLKPGNTGVDGQIAYDKAEITIFYKADPTTFFLTQSSGGGNPQPEPPGTFNLRTTYSWETVTELLHIKGGNVKDKNGQKQHHKGDIELPLKMMNLRITYHDKYGTNIRSSFKDSAGKINEGGITLDDAPFDFPFFDAKTLRYDGNSGTGKLNVARFGLIELLPIIIYETTHNFVYNPLRWDRIPIGIEPVEVGQASNIPVKIIFQDVSIYLTDSTSFSGFLQHITVS